MNFKSFFRKKTGYAVAAFLLLFLYMMYRNEAAAEDFTLRLGGTIVNVEDAGVLMMEGRWDSGPGDARAALGLYTIGRGRYKGRTDTSTQAGVYAQLVDNWGPLEAGLGVAYQQTDTIVVNSAFRFALTLGWRFDNRYLLLPDAIRVFHFSNIGSSPVNSGWDMVTLDWSMR